MLPPQSRDSSTVADTRLTQTHPDGTGHDGIAVLAGAAEAL
jgi:hypothetical protein